jgi:gamma-glutamylcyclotransferase (GGCT)/AIG2-like uncharacterized protein YtfP
MQKDNIYLFVYGSLLSSIEHPMHILLTKDATSMGKGYFQGKLYDLGEYPGAVASSNQNDRVTGELYLLHNKNILSTLDMYEGYDEMNVESSLFKRETVTVISENGTPQRAFIYLYNASVSDKSVICPGDYSIFKQPYLK